MSPDLHRTAKPPQTRDPALDGLRGLAILLVFLFHYGGGLRSANPAVRAFGYLTESGWVGVELFFVLSGFLITGLLWTGRAEPHATKNFYGRRALRILPVYLGALAAASLTALLCGATAAQLRPLLVYAAFLQNLPPLVPTALHYPPPLPLNHLWSLGVEEQFYLLWPFLLIAARTRRRALHLCLWSFALCCAFRLILFAPHLLPGVAPANWSAFLLTRGGGLALGAALALGLSAVHLQGSRVTRRWAWLALGLGGAAFLAVGFAERSLLLTRPAQFILSLPAVQIAAAGLLALALQPGRVRRLLSLSALGFMGRISYGFYVLHILLESLFDHIGRWVIPAGAGSAYQLVRLVAAFLITTAAAWLSFRFYERPFLRLKRLFPHGHPLGAEALDSAQIGTGTDTTSLQSE